MPCTWARSSMLAPITPFRPPKRASSSLRRLAPMPLMPSRDEVRRALSWRALAGDGEAVRLVAYGLDQMQPRIVARKLDAGPGVGAYQLFQPRLAFLSLGYAEQKDVVHTQLGQDLPCHVHLALAAVDQDQVRHDALPDRNLFVAALQHRAHGGVIVPGLYAGDVVAAVFRVAQVETIIDGARCHGSFALSMADVETLDALHRVRQAPRL